MNYLAFFSNLGGPDLIIILLIILVLFGSKKLPELARGMGQAMKEFHKAKEDFTDELHRTEQQPRDVATAANVAPPAAAAPRLEGIPAPVAATPDPTKINGDV